MFMSATIPDDRQRRRRPTSAARGSPTNGNVKRSTQIAERRRHRRGERPDPPSFCHQRKPAEVVDRADRRRDRRAEQQPARLAAEVEERERRHEDPEEEREPAEPRHRQLVEPPSPRAVDAPSRRAIPPTRA